jgi:hypothetical protein
VNSARARDSRPALTVVAACVAAGLIIGFFLGRFDASGPDPAPDQAGSAVVGRAPSPTPAKSNSGSPPAPTTETILADAADDPEQLSSTLRTRIKAAEEFGNPLRDVVEIAPLILALSEEQLPGALEMLAELENPFSRSFLTSTLFMRWTEMDPESAMRGAQSIQAESIQQRSSRNSALLGAVVGWVESDSDGAWNYVLAHEGDQERLQMISAFMSTLGASNPWKAAQYAERIEDPVMRNSAHTSLSRQWGRSDPDAALAWAESIDDELLLRKILPDIVGSMAATDPERAFNLALRAPDSLSRQQELDRVIRAVAESDPEKAFEFFQRIPEGVNAENLISSMSLTLESASLEQIHGYVGRVGDPKARNRMLQSAMQSKVDLNAPEEAEQLLARISKGKVRNDSFRMFAGSWSRQDPDAALEWLGQLPAGDERDSAITGFARNVVRSDPESALAWAASIDKEYIRNRTITGLSLQWMNSDRAAAAPWILASDLLTPEQKHRLLAPGLE